MGLRWDFKQILFFLFVISSFHSSCVFCLYSTWQKVHRSPPSLLFFFFPFPFFTYYHSLLHGSPHNRSSFSTRNFCSKIRSSSWTWRGLGIQCIYLLCEVHIYKMCKFMVRSWLHDALTVIKKKETSELKHVATSGPSKLLFLSAPPLVLQPQDSNFIISVHSQNFPQTYHSQGRLKTEKWNSFIA